MEEGDVVKVTIVHDTDVDHPMHLHGHFFYILSRNGEQVTFPHCQRNIKRQTE